MKQNRRSLNPFHMTFFKIKQQNLILKQLNVHNFKDYKKSQEMFKDQNQSNCSQFIVTNFQTKQVISESVNCTKNQYKGVKLSASGNSIEYCSKHQQKKGEYYEMQYPWVKYCQACALNLALCGKKIEKSLSSQQMMLKIKLCDSLQSLTSAIRLSQEGHDQFSLLSSQLQQSRQYFASVLGQVDRLISQLTQIRNVLEQHIQIYLNKEIKSIFERKSQMVNKKMDLVNEKSQIQCEFVSLIGKQNEDDIREVIQKIKLMKNEAEGLLYDESYKNKLRQNVQKVQMVFNEKINQIKNLQIKINFGSINTKHQINQSQFSTAIKKKVLHYRKKTLEDDVSDEKPKKILVSSSVQNSELISPCGQLSNQIPLMQQSQNRKNSRTALQLKARCESRSSVKRKMQVNVRENMENAMKKKLA